MNLDANPVTPYPVEALQHTYPQIRLEYVPVADH